LRGRSIRVIRMVTRDLARVGAATVGAAHRHRLAARLEEQLVDIRRAVRELIAAAEAHDIDRPPAEQRLVRRYLAARIAVVGIAIAELELEVTRETLVAQQRDQELGIDLAHVDLAEHVRLAERTHWNIDDRVPLA